MHVLTASLLAAVAIFGCGCPTASEDRPLDGGTAKPVAGALQTPAPPPHPNMATAAWGQRVLEERVGKLPEAPAKVSITDVLDALHEMTPASAVRAGGLAAAAYRSGTTGAERGNAVALLAAALVLEPTVEGYKERVTDAHGLAAYAATLDASDALGQSARAVVNGAAGSRAQAQRLIEVVMVTPGLGSEPRLFLALARRLTGDFGDATLADLKAAVAARPGSGRARAALAEAWLDLGLYPEAAETADVTSTATAGARQGADHPWLAAVRGRALVLDGKVDQGVALLQAAEPKLDEGNRGDALYWLGRSLTQKQGTPTAEIAALASTLAARPGFAKESTVLNALLAQQSADYAKARALLEPIVRGRPVLPVDADATWLLVDACAGLGDLRCVDQVGARGLAIDGDVGRLQLARAAAVLVGKATITAGVDGTSAPSPLREAHRASPFDDKLAAKVKDPVVPGGSAAASRVRAARKALLRKAPTVVAQALEPLAKTSTCRVCRALEAAAAPGPDAAKKAALAIEGGGPPLALADLLSAIEDLGAAPVKEAVLALGRLDKDARPEVQQALVRTRADHADPDARRRRDAGETKEAPHGPGREAVGSANTIPPDNRPGSAGAGIPGASPHAPPEKP